jgi:DNA-binding NarL/FixJ family response regulator
VSAIRVVIADDHTLVLEAFKAMLSDRVDVVATASDGRELIKIVRETEPDVVVTDISMPGLNGFDASMKLLKYLPDLKLIFLTVSDDPDMVAQAIRSGAKGYLLKSSAVSELLQAIETVAGGETYITPLVTGEALDDLISGKTQGQLEQLTVRQREILQLIAEGHTMKETARILSLAPRTVAFHKYRIMENLGIDNSAELVRYAYKSGLLLA